LTFVAPFAFAAEGDWHGDAPGNLHRVTVGELPAPFATSSGFNRPRIVPQPHGAVPKAPDGFAVSLFASGLQGPRLIRVAPNGDIFVAESSAGRIHVFRTGEDESKPAQDAIFASGLNRPFGIAFYPSGDDPHFVYVANTDGVVRFAYKSGDLKAGAPPENIVPKLWSDGGHWTRDVTFSPNGKRMFLSVGSGSNVAEGLAPRSPEVIRDFEAKHGLGAAWDNEENRADVLSFDPDGKDMRVFATGIRNCVTLAFEPDDGSLWCSTNERDGLGDNLPPDYVTSVREGAFYGWPWYYIGAHEDPRHQGERPDLATKITVPDVLIQPHSAPLQMIFYEGAMFPEYRGSAFVALHGSWNRATRTGSKIVRLIFKDGKPIGEYQDFLTGFIVSNEEVWGRPVGVAVDRAGALLVTEDGNGTMWRVTRR